MSNYKYIIIIISCFLITLIVSPVIHAANYYVSLSGTSDSTPGTLLNPWKTIKNSIPKSNQGDTLFVRGGTYFESQIYIGVAGNDSQHITIKNYFNEKVVVDGSILDFRTVGNSDWEVYDGTKGIYRSVKTYS